MADYYALLSRAVQTLERNTPETRETIYERARQLLDRHLISEELTLSQKDRRAEQSKFEEAIWRVELEAGGLDLRDAPTGQSPRSSAVRSARLLAPVFLSALIGAAIGGVAVYTLFVSRTSLEAEAPKAAQTSPKVSEQEVEACIRAIIAKTEYCSDLVTLVSVKIVDERPRAGETEIMARLDLLVIQSFGGSSYMAPLCTGNDWRTGTANFPAGQKLSVIKRVGFERWPSGWSCRATRMAPIESASRL